MAHHLVPMIVFVLLGGSTGSLGSPLFFQNELEQHSVSFDDGFNVEIEQLPWQVYVQSGDSICRGVIIHQNWILVLEACNVDNGNGSAIKVYAGGATAVEVRQVLDAEIFGGTKPAEEGFTLLHLKGNLVFSDYVQAARVPTMNFRLEYVVAIAAGHSTRASSVQLRAHNVHLYDSSLCPKAEPLCAFGIRLSPSEQNTAGIDFLEMFDYIDEDDDAYICVVGGRKADLGNYFVSYYPMGKILEWIQHEIGLKVVPTTSGAQPDGKAVCGLLK